MSLFMIMYAVYNHVNIQKSYYHMLKATSIEQTEFQNAFISKRSSETEKHTHTHALTPANINRTNV